MSTDIAKMLVTGFLRSSWQCVETIVKELVSFKAREDESKKRSFSLFYFKNGQRNDITVEGWHFFLRASVEYSNPQLTVEEVQGIIAARMLEASGNHFCSSGLHEADEKDIEAICERLKKPAEGLIFPFLLNTDDIEPDRYSMNPLKESIVKSGQSGFPSATVITDGLEIDQKFAQKYEGSLICKNEIELIARCLKTCGKSYMDMVDAVKYEQMKHFSESFGIDLKLPAMRMPLAIMQKETTDGLLHHVIREVHKDYEPVERVYNCIGRSMKNRTTLLTIPHSQKGFGSKRAAKGKIYFSETKLKNVKIDYATTPLYPNAIDPADVSIAVADDHFTVEGDKLVNYNFNETPSSPQFFLYILASPENAALWHGIGAFGASQLVKSYITVRLACSKDSLIKNLKERYGVPAEIPLQFNLVPGHMWSHPAHHNIDASIGCVDNLVDLAKRGMKTETLPASEFVRSRVRVKLMFFRQIKQRGDNFSYVIADETTREAAVVDPSSNADAITMLLKGQVFVLKYIINTHGHGDHTAGNKDVKSSCGGKIIAYKSSMINKDIGVDDGDVIMIGEVAIKVLYTPGHTPDGICLLVNGKLLTGDTLFVGECGRTDLPSGNSKDMYYSLFHKLTKLDDNVEVYPGHDYGQRPHSTIGLEKKTNYTLEKRTLEEFIEFMRS